MEDNVGGKIIAFEALDCCFKETNHATFCNRLQQHLTNTHSEIKLEKASFPRYGNPSSYLCTGWLRGDLDREYMKKHPSIVNSMYSLDRVYYWHEHYKPGSDETRAQKRDDKSAIFVFDRYTLSNAMYNPIYDQDTVITSDVFWDLMTFDIPMADIFIWMRMRDFDKLADLLWKKKNKDENELDLSFIRKVWERSEHFIKYHNDMDNSFKFIVIECLDEDGNFRSKEDIANEIWVKVIKELL